MRIVYALTALLLAAAGLASAGPFDRAGEEVMTLDLASAGGPTLFLKCSRSPSLTDCGLISLWQQTNPVAGLQSSIYNYGLNGYDPDHRLLG